MTRRADHAGPPAIFDRRLVRRRRARSAKTFTDHDFLHQRAMDDIVDRLETVNRDFELAVFFGAGALLERLTPACGVKAVIAADLAQGRLPPVGDMRMGRVVYDEEANPFQPERADLVVSILTLHSANDLIGALAQARATLKPDGLFVGAVFADQTLVHLRTALYHAETDATGGVSARVAPFAAVEDFGQALSRAGFALPVADIDRVTVRYEDPTRLLQDLRGMGETRTLCSPAAPLTRSIVSDALRRFSAAGGEEKFDIAYLTGWAPHGGQQKPLKPGSATASLAAAVKEKF